jgi:hypothetical protein
MQEVPGLCNLALIKGKVCNSSIRLSAICNEHLLCFSNLFSFGHHSSSPLLGGAAR